MKLNDRILILGVMIAAILMWMLLSFRGIGRKVVVYRDGEEIHRYELTDEIHLSMEYHEGQENVIDIKDGKVSVTSATCPDRICVKQGTISKKGETIVCLPHRLVIEIQ